MKFFHKTSILFLFSVIIFIISILTITNRSITSARAQFSGPLNCEGATVAGTIYIDENNNGKWDGSESKYVVKSDISTYFDVRLSPGGGSYSRLASSYQFQCVPTGTHTIQFTQVPEGYISTGSTQIFLNSGQFMVKNLGIAPKNISNSTTGSISGCVFIDINGNGVREAGETSYSGTVDIRLIPSAGTISQTIPGCYAYRNVPLGDYTLRLVTVPGGYFSTFPPTASSYNLKLHNDTSCTIVPDNGPPSCAAGSIVQANFGITQSLPWMQATMLNIRDDKGFTNFVPSTSSCETVTIRDGNNGTPGVLYTGTGSQSFGEGTLSSKNWTVSGPGTAYSRANQLRTSYNTIFKIVQANKRTFLSLSNYCSLINCTITDSIASEPYHVIGSDLTLKNVTISSKKAILLVDGDIHITGAIQVNPGAFFMIVAKGDILIDPAVGVASPSCSGTTQLQGIFSTDRNFIILGGQGCPTADNQLKIAGSIITNASGGTAGKFTNNRTLCSDNAKFPSFIISPRLDFMTNSPDYILTPSAIWQEVAP